MRCRAWVIEKPGRKLANGERAVKIESIADAYPREFNQPDLDSQTLKFRSVRKVDKPFPPRPDATLCGGEIEATVAAVDEPYYGGTSARLEIHYTCTRCKHTYHGPDLPTEGEGLSKMLTEYVANLPDVTL